MLTYFLIFSLVGGAQAHSQKLHFPFPTKHAEWAQSQVSPWLPYLANPYPSGQDAFLAWALRRAKCADVPSLYRCMIACWQKLSPGSRCGASRQSLPALLLVMVQRTRRLLSPLFATLQTPSSALMPLIGSSPSLLRLPFVSYQFHFFIAVMRQEVWNQSMVLKEPVPWL